VLTESHFIAEIGLLTTPAMITNTFNVGAVSEGVLEYIKLGKDGEMLFWGLVKRTVDIEMISRRAIQAIEKCSSRALPGGNVDQGAGMICHRFKVFKSQELARSDCRAGKNQVRGSCLMTRDM